MLDGLLGGFSQGITGYVDQERQRQRDREDLAIKQQMDLLKQLLQDPRTTPAMYGKALQDYIEMSQSNASGRKPKKGLKGFWGESETPMSDLLTHLASGSIKPEMLNTPGGQAALKGMMDAGVPPDPIAAHTPLGIHAQNSGMGFGPPGAPNSVPPAPIAPPPQATLPAPDPNQAKGGDVGATAAPPPPGPSGPAPNPPGTSQMAQAAGPLADDLNQNGPAITPPPPDKNWFEGLIPMPGLDMYGHKHDPAEDQALRYSTEHMNAVAAQQQGAIEAAKKRSDIIAEYNGMIMAGVPPDQARQAIITKMRGNAVARQMPTWVTDPEHPARQILFNRDNISGTMTPVMGPDGTQQYRETPSMYYNVPNNKGGTSQGVKGQSAAPKEIPGTAGAKIVGKEADTKRVITDANGNQIVVSIPKAYIGGTPSNRGGSAGSGGTQGSSTEVPPPPATGSQPSGPKGAKIVSNLGPKYRALTQADKSTVDTMAEASLELTRVARQMEAAGIQNDNDWASQKVANWAYQHGFKPGDDVAGMMQSVGFARAHLLKGLIGGRMAQQIAHIMDEHLPNGAQSPALMYHQIMALINRELPDKLAQTLKTARGGVYGGGEDIKVIHNPKTGEYKVSYDGGKTWQ